METTIVKILSDTTVVLGTGRLQGVREGMKFVIFELGDEVLDPVTKESLGRLELVKGHVSVTSVQEKISVAQTESQTVTKTKTITPQDQWMRLAGYRVEEYVVQQGNRLKVEDFDKQYALKLIVRVGDTARLLSD